MRALPDRHRVTVYLADMEGLRHREISKVTGIPAGSVKSCLYRGRGQLRTQLASHAPAHRPPADRRRFPDQAAPSFAALLRQGQRRKVSHLHSNRQRLTAHVDRG